MRKDLKKTITEKGQGLTEYVLILAFIAGIAFVMFGGEGSLKGKLVYTFTKAINTIGGLFDENYGFVTASRNYKSTYFENWKDAKLNELKGITNEERLKADQEGLSLIASYFLGKDQEGVGVVMAGFTNAYGNPPSNTWMVTNLANYNNVDENGWSDVLVPLSYRVTDYDNEGYLWFEASKNKNLVKEMTGEDTYTATGNRTALGARMFYSDGMIGSDSTDRAIAVKVHYATEGENAGKVDKVWIAAQSGVKEQEFNNDKKLSNNRGKLSPGASAIAGESKSVDGLELIVTGSKADYQYKIN